MAYEVITLNLIPSGEIPVIHAAQFDKARPLNFALKLGDDDFDPSGYVLELQIRKVDNNIVTAAPASTSGNVVTFNSTEQMTACSGTNLGEIQITKDDLDIATLHFYLVVQRDVLAGGVKSASDIHDLEEKIAAIVPQVIGDDYYTAEEVDEKIAEIPTFDPTNYYDKSDVDTLLNGKADVSDLPDMTNYYDKSETDALLDDKADVSDLPDMTNYYTKSEVDTKITDLYQIKTASGSIVHITDGADNIPVKELKVNIDANLSGVSSVVVSVCGKNLIENKKEQRSSSTIWLGTDVSGSSLQYYLFLKNATYTISISLPSNTLSLFLYMRGESGSNISIGSTNNDTLTATFTITKEEKYSFWLYCDSDITTDIVGTFQLEQGTATPYEAYNGTTYPISLGGTYCGGTLDVKNKTFTVKNVGVKPMTQTVEVFSVGSSSVCMRVVLSDICKIVGSIADKRNALCNDNNLTENTAYFGVVRPNECNIDCYAFTQDGTKMTVYDTDTTLTQAQFTTKYTNLLVVYPLQTPTIITGLSDTDIRTLLGENNIFSNTGDVEVQYFTSKSDGIAELIRAFL